MRRLSAVFAVLILLLLTATHLLAQSATPEATQPANQSIGELLASLPQARTADGGFVAGNPNAPITVIEFADYACPHCQEYRPVIDQMITQYVATGQAKFELRIFPTAGGETTYYAGQLVECANHQRLGDYWRAYDLLYSYAENGTYDQNMGQLLASDLHIKYDKLLHCAQSAKQVQTDINLAESSGVTGTPGVMVRYADGDPQFITLDGRTFNAGGPPFVVLAQTIEAANHPDMNNGGTNMSEMS